VALADTARLVASLELQDKFSKPISTATRGLDGFDRRLQSTQRVAQGVSRGIGNALKIGLGVAAAGGALIAVNIKKGIDSLNELENVTVATNTVLKSTNGIAGQTADGIRSLSEEFEDLNATMDDKVIQSGANMLLTFTNIRKQAFEPALEAALNMNEAMGGGPEGLQNTIIQIGKALNDPIKGVTALRKVGVALTQQQQDQVKTLVEQNDLYGAQQIILKELGTEFGGRFAAAGKTAEGRMAALGDRVEGLQQALAGPLVPVIDRVREKLIDFLGSPRVLRGAEQLGEAIASLFSEERLDKGVALLEQGIDLLTGKGGGGGDLTAKVATISDGIGNIATSVAGLPWKSIGDAARLLGTGSKALLDAFLGLPPWVQTAVLTGWGLNKLTGGALGSIVGELGKGLIKGVLGINAGVVQIKAGTVTGAGGGTAATGGRTGGGFVGRLAGTLSLVGAGVTVAIATAEVVKFAGSVGRQAEGVRETVNNLPRVTPDDLDESITKLEDAYKAANSSLASSLITEFSGTQEDIYTELKELKGIRAEQNRQSGALADGNNYARNLNSIVATAKDQRTQNTRLEEGNRYANTLNANVIAGRGESRTRLDQIRDSHNAALGTLAQIRDKPSSFTTNVTVNNDLDIGISAAGVAATLTRIALTTNQQQHTVPTVF